MIMRAIVGKLTWLQAAHICRNTARQMRRMKRRYEAHGYDGLVDGRGGIRCSSMTGTTAS